MNMANDYPKLITQREQLVLKYLCQGLTNKEIAQNLHLSYHTVKSHVTNLIHKFGVRNRTAIAYLAGKHPTKQHQNCIS